MWPGPAALARGRFQRKAGTPGGGNACRTTGGDVRSKTYRQKEKRVHPTPHRGTKRPREGADILAFRGVRCLDLSPLSLGLKEQKDTRLQRQEVTEILITSPEL